MVHKQRQADEHDKAISLIYNREALKRSKRLPDIKKLLSTAQADQVKAQTYHEQQKVLKDICRMFGFKTRKARIVWKDVSEIPKRPVKHG